MLVICRLPLKRALTGPTLSATTALNASSPVRSTDSQPAMQAFSTCGSLSAAQVVSTEAGMSRSPCSSIGYPSLKLSEKRGGVQRRCTQGPAQIRQAREIVDRQEPIDIGQQRAHACRAWLETIETQQGIEPDDLPRLAPQ